MLAILTRDLAANAEVAGKPRFLIFQQFATICPCSKHRTEVVRSIARVCCIAATRLTQRATCRQYRSTTRPSQHLLLRQSHGRLYLSARRCSGSRTVSEHILSESATA